MVDPVWLANSPDPARWPCAMRSDAQDNHTRCPWRLLYRVTYSERFLPPDLDADVGRIPQITPLMAVPVLDAGVRLPVPRPLRARGRGRRTTRRTTSRRTSCSSRRPRPARAAGTLADRGPYMGLPLPPNNVIPFDLLKSSTPIVSWGDSANSKLLTQLITSALGLDRCR